MKVIKYIFNITLLFFAVEQQAFARGGCNYEERKEINKTFSVSPDVLMEITNKYGNVNIETWNKKSIDINVEVIVCGKKQDKVNDLLRRIDIRMEQGSNYIETETIIESAQTKGWGWYKGNYEDASYTINYFVSMPITGNVDIYNKYGNIDLETLEGYADIELKYGNLETDDIGKDVELDLGYGNADIGQVQNVDMNIKYSKIEIEACKQFDLESKYSSYKIGEVELLDIDYCKYDKYKIDKVGTLDSENKYTTFNIKELTNQLEVDCSYGKINVDNVSADFDLIKIDCSYTPISIDINNQSGAQVYVDNTYGSIDFYDSNNVSYTKENHTKMLEGTLGNGAGKIVIESNYGSVDIE